MRAAHPSQDGSIQAYLLPYIYKYIYVHLKKIWWRNVFFLISQKHPPFFLLLYFHNTRNQSAGMNELINFQFANVDRKRKKATRRPTGEALPPPPPPPLA